MDVNLILGAIVLFSICAISFTVIYGERKKEMEERDGSRESCGFCKHFEPCRGNSCIGNCTFFFKSFKPWDKACHRFELKELKGGEA